MNYQLEESVAIKAVVQAARVCQKVRADLASEETLIKKDRSPVTVADFSSQAIISRFLKKSFPNDPLVAEESASDLMKYGDDFIRERVFESVRMTEVSLSDEEILQALDGGGWAGGGAGRFWTLDPIDGTKGFLRGEQYAISLALIENGQVVLGVLGCPNFPEDWRRSNSRAGYLFAAQKDQGAYQQKIGDSEKRPIQVSDVQSPEEAIFCESVESGHSSHNDSKMIAERLGVTNPPLRLDSQCKYAAVARGDASIYLRLPTSADYQEKIWDHAAGVIVLEEAGGRVTDIHGRPLDFSLGRTLRSNQGVVAASRSIHEQAAEAVRSVLER